MWIFDKTITKFDEDFTTVMIKLFRWEKVFLDS
jgi:hypothetical protein